MPERSAKKVCQTQLHCRIRRGIKPDSAHCVSSRILHSMPGHLRICAMSEATCSRRSPPLPQRPVFSTFLRGGLHFGCRTTSSRDLTATRWGNCTTRGGPTRRRHAVRRLHVAQTPTTSGLEGAASPTRPGAMSVGAKEFAQHGPYTGTSAKKTRPASAKTPNLGCCERAGQTFSRPARQLLEIKTVKVITTHSHCPRETAGTNVLLR